MTCIFHIQDSNGHRVESFKAVSDVMTDFYKNLLGRTEVQRANVDPRVIKAGPSLSLEHQVQLCRPFSNTKIKQMFCSIPNHKSPGPDGFSSGFYKACWGDIGPLVCNAINKFFSTGYLREFFCQTKLVLLPKINNPNKAKDFRPISCCKTVYECITNLICSRLKEVLPHIIDKGQWDFVKGRELLFNVLLC